MRNALFSVGIPCVLAVTAAAGATAAREPVVGLPCEHCELVFEGMPDSLRSVARIAPATEPGEPLRIDGVVRDAAGHPRAGVIVYAYHTNRDGIYPRAATRHGALRGWARSDTQGRYRFDTIRPGGYPGTDIPQHIHMHIIEPGRCTYWIDDIHFDDDPRLNDRLRREFSSAPRAGSGLAEPARDAGGTWRVSRDIVLGANIPGYPDPGR